MAIITATEALVLLVGFFEGSALYSFLGMMTYYTLYVANCGNVSMSIAHWFLTNYCLGITFIPMVYATKLGLYGTILLISGLGCLVSPLFLLHYHYMIVPSTERVHFIDQKIVYGICLTLYGLTCGCKHGCILGIVRYGLPTRSDDDAMKGVFSFSCTLIHYAGMFVGYFPFVIRLDEYYEMDFYNIFIGMIVSNFLGFAILGLGWRKLHFNEIKTSAFVEFIKLSYFILKTKTIRTEESQTKISKYMPNDIAKLKCVYRMLPLFIPVITLIALRDQKFTRFVSQATAMNNKIREIGVHPTFLLSVSPLIICITLSVLMFIRTSLSRKIDDSTRTTQRSLGIFIFAVLAFAGIVIIECKVEASRQPYIKPNAGHLQIYNTATCPATLNFSGYATEVVVSPFNFSVVILQHLAGESVRKATLEIKCSLTTYRSTHTVRFLPDQTVSYAIIIDFYSQRKNQLMTKIYDGLVGLSQINVYECSVSSPTVRIVYDVAYDLEVEFRSVNHDKNYTHQLKAGDYDIPGFCLIQDEYTIWINNILMRHDIFGTSGEFTLLLSYYDKSKLPGSKILVITPASQISILYQLPQLVLIDFVELMIRAPGFIYAGTKVPPEWRDLLTTLWYASEALGNLVGTIAGLAGGISRHLHGFILWYGLGVLTLIAVSELLLIYYKTDYDELAEKRGIIK